MIRISSENNLSKCLRYEQRTVTVVCLKVNSGLGSQNPRNVVFVAGVVVRRTGRNPTCESIPIANGVRKCHVRHVLCKPCVGKLQLSLGHTAFRAGKGLHVGQDIRTLRWDFSWNSRLRAKITHRKRRQIRQKCSLPPTL